MAYHVQPTKCKTRYSSHDVSAHASVVTSLCPPFHTPVVSLPGRPLLVSDRASLRPLYSITTSPLRPAERRCYASLIVTSCNPTVPHVKGST